MGFQMSWHELNDSLADPGPAAAASAVGLGLSESEAKANAATPDY